MTSTSFPRTRRARHPRRNSFGRGLATIALVLAGSGAFFWAVSSTLTEMTWQDCQAGVAKACEELQK